MKIYDYNGKKNISGDRIRQARVVQRMRQEDLAAKLQIAGVNMERDSISRIEIGTRFVSDFELKVFAKVLGFSLWRNEKAAGLSRRNFFIFFRFFLEKLLTLYGKCSII